MYRGYLSREAKLGGLDIGDVDHVFIPQKEDSSSGPKCRALGKASQSTTSQVTSSVRVHNLEFSLLEANYVTR